MPYLLYGLDVSNNRSINAAGTHNYSRDADAAFCLQPPAMIENCVLEGFAEYVEHQLRRGWGCDVRCSRNALEKKRTYLAIRCMCVVCVCVHRNNK